MQYSHAIEFDIKITNKHLVSVHISVNNSFPPKKPWKVNFPRSAMAQDKLAESVMALIKHPFVTSFTWLYLIFQAVLRYVFSPVPPPPGSENPDVPRKRIAVIGAGLTGVSSAAHCVGHGFDVQVFESRSKEKGLGGIWSVCVEHN